MSDVNFYENIVGMLTGEASNYLMDLVAYLGQALLTTILLNFIFLLLLLFYTYKKFQSHELVSLKTAFQMALFLFYVGFFNWAIAHPKVYMEYADTLVRYPSNLITAKVAELINAKSTKVAELGGGVSRGISVLLHSTFRVIIEILDRVFNNFSLATIGASVLQIFLSILLALFQGGFLLQVMLIIVITTIEILFWLGASILVLPLLFFKETRGMVGMYLKKLLSLTLYKPFIFCLAFLNFNIIDTIILQMPNDEQIRNNLLDKIFNMFSSNFQGAITLTSFLTIMIISSFLIFSLIKRVPDVINSFFGVHGGVGDIAAFIQQGSLKIAGVTTGALAGVWGARVANAYRGAGGGAGGILAGGGAAFSAGASNLFGSKIGGKLNEALHTTAGGSKLNEALTQGVNFSSKFFHKEKS